MAWNPLRRHNKPTSKPCLASQGDDGLLEKYVVKLEELENSSKKLHKDAKKYEDIILEVTRCEKKMTTDLSNSLICQEEQQLREILEEWHSFVSEANPVDEDLVLAARRTVVEPIKRFQGIFSEYRNALKKREQISQEYAKVSSKVQKLQEKEKTGANYVKIETAKQNLRSLEEDFKKQDKILRDELPQMYEGRIEYLQPCLEALIKAQVQHSGDIAKITSQNLSNLNEFTYSDLELQEIQQQRLSSIQGLSIVADK